ncbi:hypothetical protein [Gordoniibacillus kamchatkensis]|uniref:hypothetical protein n=1 Tax=Gordoniibacillus kamchatkensis TaxID=1590651 RepID=UPI000697A3D8|nr:hypothetical protein [Paenibacillus sp. VKM B-2647]
MQLQTIIPILLGIFILYRIYLRVRRSFGWQQLNPGKMGTTIIVLSVIGLLFLIVGGLHPISLISDAIGILFGVSLAYVGASLTRFEQRNGSWHYRPNTWIGGIVTLLFFGRLIYRIYGIFTTTSGGGLDRLQAMAGGWTAGLMLIMFAYYVVYNMIILQKQKQSFRLSK